VAVEEAQGALRLRQDLGAVVSRHREGGADRRDVADQIPHLRVRIVFGESALGHTQFGLDPLQSACEKVGRGPDHPKRRVCFKRRGRQRFEPGQTGNPESVALTHRLGGL